MKYSVVRRRRLLHQVVHVFTTRPRRDRGARCDATLNRRRATSRGRHISERRLPVTTTFDNRIEVLTNRVHRASLSHRFFFVVFFTCRIVDAFAVDVSSLIQAEWQIYSIALNAVRPSDRVRGEGNAIGHVRPSVCFYLIFWTNWRLTLFSHVQNFIKSPSAGRSRWKVNVKGVFRLISLVDCERIQK